MSLPVEIKQNPEIDVPVDGIRGWKVGSDTGLVIFFEIDKEAILPEHTHCFQWGVVISGEMELTIGGEARVYRPGDSYKVPEGVPHSGRFNMDTVAMDYFSDPTRY
jgi:quercetin dioxygenase-like cupin family protein